MKIPSVILASIPFGVAAYLTREKMMTGFPDGARTEFERAMAFPQTIVIVLSVLAGIYFLNQAFRVSQKADLVSLAKGVALYTLLFALTHGSLCYYFGSVLKLNHGQGG